MAETTLASDHASPGGLPLAMLLGAICLMVITGRAEAQCAGNCGEQSPDGCWCDTYCHIGDDCCDDVCDACGGPPCGIDQCDGQCFTTPPQGCWCDHKCVIWADCCNDVCDHCDDQYAWCDGNRDSCLGLCGGLGPNNDCACDEDCHDRGDCCSDVCQLCGTCMPGDINEDDVVDSSDLLILVSAWGPCDDPDDCPADINGDGVVDASDLLILLGNWG